MRHISGFGGRVVTQSQTKKIRNDIKTFEAVWGGLFGLWRILKRPTRRFRDPEVPGSGGAKEPADSRSLKRNEVTKQQVSVDDKATM